jgi:outer membrane lipoprotein SlyB
MKTVTAAFTALLLLDGCVQQPLGPSIQVMPAPGKPFDVFQQDQAQCKAYADQQTAGGAQQANNQQVLTGVVGTVLGAGLGAAVGGGRGAAIGAGAGAVGGTAVGAGPAQYAQMSLQQRYDAAYAQCMYANGDQVPGYSPAPPPPGYGPPPGYPPPPPPGYGPPPGYPPPR